MEKHIKETQKNIKTFLTEPTIDFTQMKNFVKCLKQQMVQILGIPLERLNNMRQCWQNKNFAHNLCICNHKAHKCIYLWMFRNDNNGYVWIENKVKQKISYKKAIKLYGK